MKLDYYPHQFENAAQQLQSPLINKIGRMDNATGNKENQFFYNIHALKLRQLKGYSLESRQFAMAFREKFKAFVHDWPNVSTAFGPLTLMQGWKQVDLNGFADDNHYPGQPVFYN